MCCWIWFTGIYWQVLYLCPLGKFVYVYVCVWYVHMFVCMYVCAVDICKYVSECVHAYVGMYVHAWMYVCLFTRVSVHICFGYQANVGCLEWWNFWWKLWRICPVFVLSLWGVFSFFFFLNDCFSLAVFMGLLKLLVCPWFNFGRSHISRGLFISSRLPDSFKMCVFKAFPNDFLDFIGVQWDVPFFHF